MINVMKYGDKLIGVYQIHLDNELLQTIKDVKAYLIDNLMEEIKKDASEDLFTYKILNVNELKDTDLLGRNCEIMFEFVPNQILFKEIAEVTERLQIGL
jgi:hypothetical protein